jgi:aminopeptidase N
MPVLRALLALVLALGVRAGAAAAGPLYDLAVRIEPGARTVAASGTLTLPPGEALDLVLRADFVMERLAVDGRDALAGRRVRDDLQAWRIPASKAERSVAAAWRGTLAPLDAGITHRQTLGAAAPVAGEEGTQLLASSRWYPHVPGMLAEYRIAVDVPDPQRAVAPGRLVEERTQDGRYRAVFDFPHPAEGIDLVAGPYRIASRSMKAADGREIRLRTYFHPSVAALADGYLESTQRYVEMYDKWIGPYPFTEFSVVSSPTPTGFGMPAMTYLGVDVLRLPFIRATSLGHEVLHNWWGNGVYPDYAGGNWSEGLTTFMADYAYREREGDAPARAMRVEWLRDFAAVPPGRDQPLAGFTSRTHGATQIVGYHKAAMLFLMLRDRIGADAFDRGLQAFWREHRFRTASWSDLRAAFEQASGEKLGPFFAQWLTRAGAPALRLESAATVQDSGGWRTDVTLSQPAPAYQLRVPLVFRTPRGDETRWVTLNGERQTFRIALDLQPTAVLLDPDFRVFRRLAPDEAPPILRQVMIDAATATVIVSEGEAGAAARALAERLQEHPPRMAAAEAAPPGAPLLVIGLAADVDRWLARQQLPPRPQAVAGKGTAQVWTQARERAASLVVVSGDDAAALAALLRPLPHYGRQSWLTFDAAKAVDRGVWPGQAVQLRLR